MSEGSCCCGGSGGRWPHWSGRREEEKCECEQVDPGGAIAELAKEVEMLREAVQALKDRLGSKED